MGTSTTQQFCAGEFVATQWDSAEDKAKFANHFVRFVRSGYKRTLFPKWFYRRLSMCFGHIAHYNQAGFYAEWFADDSGRFLRNVLQWGCYGDPAYTYSDVERALQTYYEMGK
jgi:hypothetical protein